jgi:hypothetical protein
MARFDYLKGKPVKAKKVKAAPAPDQARGETQERVEAVYVRRETVRAVWREVKKAGGESVSELVEDLLLAWLRERR